MALHSLYCADVPLRNCSLTHSLTVYFPQSPSAGIAWPDPCHLYVRCDQTT